MTWFSESEGLNFVERLVIFYHDTMNFRTFSAFLSLMLFTTGISAQESTSLMVVTEYFRSWGVASDGYSLTPVGVNGRFLIGGRLFLTLGIGYDRDRTTTEDFPEFSREVTLLNSGTGVMTFTQLTTTFDQAIAFTPGIRISVPGGPERLRLWLGADGISVFYPARTLMTLGRTEVTDEQGEIVQFSQVETIGAGYQGYGLGVRGVIGVEWRLLDGLLLGIEIGPGITTGPEIHSMTFPVQVLAIFRRIQASSMNGPKKRDGEKGLNLNRHFGSEGWDILAGNSR